MPAQKKLVKTLLTIAGTFVVVLLAGCGSQADRLTLDVSDSGTQVELAPGEEVDITLRTDSTKGAWMVREVDTTVLQQVGDAAVWLDQPETESSGGTQTFRFRAAAPGQTSLKIDYFRLAEEVDTDGGRRFTLSVIVH